MAVNCSTRIKKIENELLFCLLHLHLVFLYNLFLPHLFPFIISSRVLHHPPSPPWVVLLCVCELGLLPTMAFVFYHKFMWLTSRLRQAERGRQSAELDNRLFKQDFGDKINSLQLEVEALTRQR